MSIKCQVCGQENVEGSKYCEGCGVELQAAPAASPAAEPVLTPPAGVPEVKIPDITIPKVEIPKVELPEVVNPAAPTEVPPPQSPTSASPEVQGAVEPQMPLPSASSPDPVAEMATPPVSATAPAATPTTALAKLGLKKYGALTGESIPLQGERLVVGRFDPSSGPVDIDLSSPVLLSTGGPEHISRRHAELYQEDGHWMVRDLGSTNGVYLKRRGEAAFSPRLAEPTALADGDEIAFGNIMLVFQQS